jgi:hypothetical protein
MGIEFLTPLSALATLLVLIPLGAFLLLGRRDAAVRRTLSLPPAPRARGFAVVFAIVATAGLVGAAAAQPVVQHGTTHRERTDAAAYVVFDISRSMLASRGLHAPDRLERAKRFALAFRPRIESVPVGVASLTDRVLPHLFPTSDMGAFATVVRNAIQVEAPPPALFYATRATKLSALGQLRTAAFFRPQALHRLLVVVTDGESLPVSPSLAQTLRKPPGVQVLFVHVWDALDRIYSTSVPAQGYLPDPTSRQLLERAAASLGGKVVSSGDVAGAVSAAKKLLGPGPVRSVSETARLALMPYVAAAAFLPLGFLLYRRNL